MRPHIPFLDTAAMTWTEVQPGLMTKMLSRDGATGARTALNRIVPELNPPVPTKAHYHHTTEELLVVAGRMSFDSQVWLTPGGYVFHPAETVHGFKSAVTEDTQFLSRVGRDLDFNWVDHPKATKPYHVSVEPPRRAVTYLAEPDKLRWEPLAGALGKVERAELSRDPVTGEGSMFVRYAAEAATPQVMGLLAYEEMFVLDGALATDDGRLFQAGCYAFWPPGGTPRPQLTALKPTVAYVNVGGWMERR